MDISYAFACQVVSDRDQAAAWYQQLLGRPADLLPNDAEAMWQLTGTSSVYLLADTGRAGRGTLTLAVTDLDAAVTELGGRGIVGGRAEVIAGAGRKCVFADPDGNEVALVELLG